MTASSSFIIYKETFLSLFTSQISSFNRVNCMKLLISRFTLYFGRTQIASQLISLQVSNDGFINKLLVLHMMTWVVMATFFLVFSKDHRSEHLCTYQC